MKAHSDPHPDDVEETADMQCPGCGADMRRVFNYKLAGKLGDKPTALAPVAKHVCDDCGYQDTSERGNTV